MEREINLLSDHELNAVVGGRMNVPHVTDTSPSGVAGSFASNRAYMGALGAEVGFFAYAILFT